MKKFLAILLILTLLFSLYACGSAQNTPDTQTSPSNAASSSNETNYETSLSICIDQYLYEMEYKGILDRFANEHPEIELDFTFIHLTGDEAEWKNEVTSVQTALMAGRGPDIYIINNAYNYTANAAIFSDINLIMESGVFSDTAPLLESVGISMDEFVPTVMAAGQLDGKQYVVPLNYSVNLVLTNDKTYELLGGDNAFKSASNFMDAVLNLSRTPGTFSKTFLGADMSSKKISTYFNPFYLSSPPLIDYSTRSVTIDSAFTRDVLNKASVINANVAQDYYNKSSAGAAPSDGTWKAWNDYIASDKYIHLDSLYALMAQEAAYLDVAGVTPHLNLVPSEDGGGCAIITSYIAVNAGTEHKQEAAELLKLLLSDEVQSNGSASTAYMPVRKGLIPDIIGKFVNKGLAASSSHYPPNGTYFFESSMSEETLQQFSSIEDSLTSARFRPPTEIYSVLLEHYSGQRDVESAITEMQQYSANTMWAAT